MINIQIIRRNRENVFIIILKIMKRNFIIPFLNDHH